MRFPSFPSPWTLAGDLLGLVLGLWSALCYLLSKTVYWACLIGLPILCALSSCSKAHAQPAQLAQLAFPSDPAQPAVIPIKWHVVQDTPQVEVRDGTCHIYAPDTSQARGSDRIALEPLAMQCYMRIRELIPGTGDFDLWWVFAGTTSDLIRYYEGVYGAKLWAKGHVEGFYRRENTRCMVGTLRGYPSLAHELRHCYTGDWHL